MGVSRYLAQVLGGGVVGGLLGSLIIRYLDIRSKSNADKKELKGAFRLVEYELTINLTTISLFLEKNCKSKPGPIRDETYRSVQKLLACELGDEDMIMVAAAYESLPVFRENMDDLYRNGKKIKRYTNSLEFYLVKLREARNRFHILAN